MAGKLKTGGAAQRKKTRGRKGGARGRLQRWVRRVLIVILLLAFVPLLVLIVAQVVLGTDLPRSLVEDALRKQTGLDIRIESLHASLSGGTTLDQFRVGLPLEEDPFLTADRVSISHTDLLVAAITQSFALAELKIDQPTLTLRQDATGQWNVLEAAQLVQSVQGEKSASGVPPIDLPQTILTDATIVIRRPDEAPLILEKVTFEGRPVSPRSWAFSGTLSDFVRVEGRVAAGATFEHEVSFAVTNATTLARAFVPLDPSIPTISEIRGQWHGSIVKGDLSGRLRLEPVEAAGWSVGGTAQVLLGETIELRPKDFVVRSLDDEQQVVRVKSGRLRLVENRIEASRLSMRGMGFDLVTDATWNPAELAGEAEVHLRGHTPNERYLHTGVLRVNASMGRLGGLESDAQFEITTVAPRGELTMRGQAHVAGENVNNVNWQVRGDSLAWRDEQGVVSTEALAIAGTYRDGVVEVLRTTVPFAASGSLTGRYAIASQAWRINLNADEWNVPRIIVGDLDPFDLRIQATGVADRAELHLLRFEQGPLTVDATGTYAHAIAMPLNIQASMTITDPLQLGAGPTNGSTVSTTTQATEGQAEAAATVPADEDGPIDVAVVREVGRLVIDANIAGRLAPLDLTTSGMIHMMDVVLGEQSFQDVSFPWEGVVTSEHATFDGEPFMLLAGKWDAAARYKIIDNELEVSLSMTNLPIERLVALSGRSLETTGRMDLSLEALVPDLDPTRIELEGDWRISDFTTGDVRVDRGTGRMRARERRLSLENLRLESSSGTIDGRVDVDLEDVRDIRVTATLADWPIAVSDLEAGARVSGSFEVGVNPFALRADGIFALQNALLYRGEPIGELVLDGSVSGRTINVPDLHGTLLGATMTGSGSLPLEDWTKMSMRVDWKGLDLRKLDVFDAELASLLHGRSVGTILVSTGEERNPARPLTFRIEGDFEGGAVGTIALGPFEIVGSAGTHRQVISSARANIAGGYIKAWGRHSEHTFASGETGNSVHVTLNFRQLQLNQFVQMGTPDAASLVGILNGQISLGGYLGEPSRSFGSGRVEVSRSDLAALPFFSVIYDVLRLQFDDQQPTGRGILQFRVEGPTIEVTNMAYFNRGTDVLASATIRDFWKAQESSISGIALGSIRPFRDLDLPLVTDLDKLVNALQSSAATVIIGGTVAEPTFTPVPFAEVARSAQRLLEAAIAR